MSDLDMDGDPDLVTHARGGVYWFERTGDSFAAPQRILPDGEIRRLVLGDLDGDGDEDVVIVSVARTNNVQWFENTLSDAGTPLLRAREQLPFSEHRRGVTIETADLDQDGKAELWIGTASAGQPAISRYELRNGRIEMTYLRTLDANDQVWLIADDDVDGDGDKDLIVDRGSLYNFYTVWYENVNGQIGTDPLPLRDDRTSPNFDSDSFRLTHLELVDIDDDGDDDFIAVGNQLTDLFNTLSAFYVIEKLDARTFAPPVRVAAAPFGYLFNGPAKSLLVGDTDGDGDIDALTTWEDGSRMDFWENTDGQGTYEHHFDPHGLNVTLIDVGQNRSAELIYTIGDGVYSMVTHPNGPIHVLDVNRDERIDVVMSVSEMLRHVVWQSTDALGNFVPDIQLPVSSVRQLYRTSVFDLDGDGWNDLVQLDADAKTVRAIFAGPEIRAGADVTPVSLGSFTQNQLTPIDFDRDGDMDLVGSNPNTVTYENINGKRLVPKQFVSATEWFDPIVIDVDSDGDDDLLVGKHDEPPSWLENVAGTFSDPVPIAEDVDLAPRMTLDMDGDGDEDVIYRSHAIANGWLENLGRNLEGKISFIHHEVPELMDGKFADLDRDGDPDFVQMIDRRLVWVENVDGRARSWATHEIGELDERFPQISLVDLDGDGDADVVVQDNARVIWYRNDTPSPRVGDFDGDFRRFAADIDILFAAVRFGVSDPRFDVNDDDQVDQMDATYWIETLLETSPGDANLDGRFDSADLVHVFSSAEYADVLNGNSGWATGDWNGDGEFDSADLVVAFQSGGYVE